MKPICRRPYQHLGFFTWLIFFAWVMSACGFMSGGPHYNSGRVANLTHLPTLTRTPLPTLTPTPLVTVTPEQTQVIPASLATVLPSPLPGTSPDLSSQMAAALPSAASPALPTIQAPINGPDTIASTAPSIEANQEIPSATPVPVTSSKDWTFKAVQTYTDDYENGLLLYGEVINNTGAAQHLNFITGTFYDPQGQVIAGTEISDAYWPIEVIPSGGSLPFELTVDGARNTTNIELGVEAEPSSQNPHQDFEIFNLEQSNQAGKYCITGQIRNLGDDIKEYLVIAVILYDANHNIVNFSPFQEPDFENLVNNQALDIDSCIGLSDQNIADYAMRAWGQ